MEITENDILLESVNTQTEKYINELTTMDAADIQSPFEYLPAGAIDGYKALSKSVISRYYQESLSKHICNFVPMIGPTGMIFLTTKNVQGDRKVISASGSYELNTIQSRITPEFLADVLKIYKTNAIEFVSKMISQDMLETLDALVVTRIKAVSLLNTLTFSANAAIADNLKLKTLNIRIENIISDMAISTKRGCRAVLLVSKKVAIALSATKSLLPSKSQEEEHRDFLGYLNGIHKVFLDTNNYMALAPTVEGALIMHDGPYVGDRPMVVGAYSNLLSFHDNYSVTQNAVMIRNRQMFLRNPIDTQILGNITPNSSAFSTFLTVDFTNTTAI